jgi:pyruvate carboxylase
MRREVSAHVSRAPAEQQLASYLMYPKVFKEYAAHRSRFGDVARLPTPVFFYGMRPGEEISLELERGKTLIVRYVAQSEPHEDASRTVFFELNGQPRSIRVIDRSQKPTRQANRKADPSNPRHIGAPMPGSVRTVSVSAGQKIARGAVVATLEAMKLEATVCADLDGVVAEVVAKPAMQVDAKDLLIVLQ